MKTGLTKIVIGFLLTALPSALFAEGDMSIPLHLCALASSDGKTAVSPGAALPNPTTASGADLLRFIQTIPLNPRAQYASICAVMTKRGKTYLHAVEYMRNMEPDPGQPRVRDCTTRNRVAKGNRI
jgi:hypothetical protein